MKTKCSSSTSPSRGIVILKSNSVEEKSKVENLYNVNFDLNQVLGFENISKQTEDIGIEENEEKVLNTTPSFEVQHFIKKGSEKKDSLNISRRKSSQDNSIDFIYGL